MRKSTLKKLLALYPKKFRDHYADQIIDIYEQGGRIPKKDLILSILSQNAKRLATVLGSITLLPSLFFVTTNLWFYTFAQVQVPPAIDSLNNTFDVPLLILGSLGLTLLLGIYASLNTSLKITHTTIAFKLLGFNRNILAVVTSILAILVLTILMLYLVAENIGL